MEEMKRCKDCDRIMFIHGEDEEGKYNKCFHCGKIERIWNDY